MYLHQKIFPVILTLTWIFVGCSTSHSAFRRPMQLVLLGDAPAKYGAMCLDGSPPGFYYRPGFGDGRSKWIVHLQGGSWCFTEADCALRSQGMFGSTNNLSKTAVFSKAGILSHVRHFNPDFYNWNMVHVMYCDGGSFTGYREDPLVIDDKPLYFRGRKIREAVFKSLLTMGMERATDVILTGCSAGAVATFIHADYVQTLFQPHVKYVAMPDAGIFADTPQEMIQWQEFLGGVYNVHNSSGGLDVDCVQEYKPLNEEWRCFQAQYAVPHVTTPMFFYSSIHDSGLLAGMASCFIPSICRDLENILPVMREEFFNATVDIESREGVGLFFDSCIRHCQSVDDSWFRSVRVDGLLAREVFANWYFERNGKTKVVDCEYPCNDSCGVPRDVFGNDSPLQN